GPVLPPCYSEAPFFGAEESPQFLCVANVLANCRDPSSSANKNGVPPRRDQDDKLVPWRPTRLTSEVTRGSNLFPHPTQDVAEGWFISLHRGQTLGEWVVGTLTKPEGNPAMLLSPAGRVTRARKPKMFKKKPARNHGHALSE